MRRKRAQEKRNSDNMMNLEQLVDWAHSVKGTHPVQKRRRRTKARWVLRTCPLCQRQLVHVKRPRQRGWTCSRCGLRVQPRTTDRRGGDTHLHRTVKSIHPLPPPRVGLLVVWARTDSKTSTGQRPDRTAKKTCRARMSKWVAFLS